MSMIRTYTETYDMNTEKDSPCILAVHTPIGKAPRQFLEPAFRMYKKFKYLGCDMTIVNSARLPVDPEQVGRIEGTNYVDPRDTLNPILFKGCHGESINGILNSMYAGLTSEMFKESSLDKTKAMATLSNFYYTAIGDDSWRKSPIQKTLTIRGLHPLVYGLATQHQLMPTNDMDVSNYSKNNPQTVTPSDGSAIVEDGLTMTGSSNSWASFAISPTQVSDPTDASAPYLQRMLTMFTNRVQRLGWMDTLQFVGNMTASAVGWTRGQVTELPKIFMGILILPPAYLCRQYLRVIIRHKFAFNGYRSVTTGGIDSEQWNPYVVSYGYHDKVTGNVSNTSKDIDDSYLGRAPESADGVPEEVEPDESE